MHMKLDVPQVKNHVVPIRLTPALFTATAKIARQNKTKHSTILRLLIEKALSSHATQRTQALPQTKMAINYQSN